jgi:anthranilate phosphoribosyltransferase
LGFEYSSPQAIQGGDAVRNAQILQKVLSGEPGTARKAVLVNAAFAIVAGGKAEEVREGIALAERSIDSGAAMDRLRAFLTILGPGGDA